LAAALAYRRAYPPVPGEATAVLDVVDDQVAEIRGLAFKRPASFTLTTSDALRRKVEEEAREEWSPEEAVDDETVLAAFDFVRPDEVDLYEIMQEFEATQIAGYYDPDDQTLFVVSNRDHVSPYQRTTLAHELVHALQDQHFGLDRLTDEGAGADLDSEAKIAFRALVEGDARFVESRFTRAHLAPHEYALVARELLQHDSGALENMPQILLDVIGFPYQQGEAFVRTLYDLGGWKAVDDAYRAPPRTTEHILHPERYRAGDGPRTVRMVPLTETLGAGWRWVDEDITGEFVLRQHLAGVITPTVAAGAAAGWGGDRYVVFRRDGEPTPVLLQLTVWDDADEAAAFTEAYVTYLGSLYADGPYLTADDRLCWRDAEDARCIWRVGDEAVNIARAPRAVDVEHIYRAVREAVPSEGATAP